MTICKHTKSILSRSLENNLLVEELTSLNACNSKWADQIYNEEVINRSFIQLQYIHITYLLKLYRRAKRDELCITAISTCIVKFKEFDMSWDISKKMYVYSIIWFICASVEKSG